MITVVRRLKCERYHDNMIAVVRMCIFRYYMYIQCVYVYTCTGIYIKL